MNQNVAHTVLARDPYCVVCGRVLTDYHLHHRRLRKHGGQDCPSNLVAIHSRCHTWVHGHPEASYERGYLVPSWQEPAEWPLLLPNGTTVRLAPEGGYLSEMKENSHGW